MLKPLSVQTKKNGENVVVLDMTIFLKNCCRGELPVRKDEILQLDIDAR